MAVEFHTLKISGIVQETHDTRSFIFDIPSELRSRFIYQAGQFLTFDIPWQDIRIRRCYSLSSALETDAWHKVTVKRVLDGRASNWFNDQLKVGDSILVQAPEGRFVMDPKEMDRPITLFGGGSGITPMISILKSALSSTRRNILLVYANRDASSIIFKDELDLLIKRFPDRLSVIHHLDSEHGFMTAVRASQLVQSRNGSDFYVCGPTPFMDLVEASLHASNVDGAHRFFERFTSPMDADRVAAQAPAPVAPPTEGLPTSFTMILDKKKYEVPYKKGLTLLKAAQVAGHKPPSSCEDGYCGCCMAYKRSGDIHMKSPDALTAKDIDRGWILPCQSTPTSPAPIVIDFDEKY